MPFFFLKKDKAFFVVINSITTIHFIYCHGGSILNSSLMPQINAMLTTLLIETVIAIGAVVVWYWLEDRSAIDNGDNSSP